MQIDPYPWDWPWDIRNHTQCEACGDKNCQVVEYEEQEEGDDDGYPFTASNPFGEKD